METVVKVFRGRRVFLTGDTGFKGSWLAFWLTRLGAEVTGYALPPRRERNPFRLLKLDRAIHHIDGDVRDASAFSAAVRRARPEFFFHLAAQSLVRRSYEIPAETFAVNVGGTVNALEACRGVRTLRAAVMITSDKCYRNKEWIWGYREMDELGGDDPYSASKAAAEAACAAYLRSFFPNGRPGVATARAGNVIGGGDWSADRVIPDAVRALGRGKPVPIRRPEATRPWQHVLEPLSGYLRLAAALAEDPRAFAGAWNFGPTVDACVPVRTLVEKFIGHWGSGRALVRPEPGAPKESTFLFLNCDKAQRRLGWRPRWTLDRALAETARWYRALAAGEPMEDVMAAQIRAFTPEA